MPHVRDLEKDLIMEARALENHLIRSDAIDARIWLDSWAGSPGFSEVERALSALIDDEKIFAVWISGSRVTGETDEHSDTDIRVHAPGWIAADFSRWLVRVDPSRQALVRLSKFGSTMLNYECVLPGRVGIDLLVFAGECPKVSFDSVILKSAVQLERELVSQVIKAVAIEREELRNLMDGVVIDQQKFAKLFVRGERLAAWFLLEAVRFALLRLAYIAACGEDCGTKQLHTLASLKLVCRAIRERGSPALAELVEALAADGTLEASAACVGKMIDPLFGELRARFLAGESRGVGENVRVR